MEGGDRGFWDRLAQLASSYLPEWNYRPGGEDPAAVLLELCGEILLDSRRRTERLLEKHETEFVNCIDPRPEEAVPESSCARFLAAPGSGGVFLETGTRLYTPGGAPLLSYTLSQPLYVARCEVAELFFVSPGQQSVTRPRRDAEGFSRCEPPLPLFSPCGEELWERELRVRHPDLLRDCGEGILFLRFSCADPHREKELPAALAKEAGVTWLLSGPEGETPLPAPHAAAGRLVFHTDESTDARTAHTADTLILRGLPGASLPETAVNGVRLSAMFPPRAPETVFSGEALEDVNAFLPFGETLERYRDCYLASRLFSRRGAEVTLRFTLACRTVEQEYPIWETPAAEMKYVMRKPPALPTPVHSEVRADAVRLSYFNGSGWLDLPETARHTRLFRLSDGETRACSITFRCPADSAACMVNAVESNWIRLRLAGAENAGRLPCTCFSPELRDLTVSCTYETAPVAPVELLRTHGRETLSLTAERLSGGVALFENLSGPDTLYLGLTEIPRGSPFRLLFRFDQENVPDPLPCAFFYSGKSGFSPLETVDATGGLTRTGLLSFSIPEDFTRRRLFGRNLCWIRIVDPTGKRGRMGAPLPPLRALLTNCAAIQAQSGGGAGGLAEGDSLYFPEARSGISRITAVMDGYGGSGPEEPAETQRRALEYFQQYGRMVTLRDFEQTLRRAGRDIDKVKCLAGHDAGSVTAAVLMRDFENRTTAFQARAPLLKSLARRLSALEGLSLSFLPREPEFIPVSVSVWLSPLKNASPFEAQRRVRRAIDDFLHPVHGGFAGSGWEIGDLPTRDQLFAYLNSLGLPYRLEELIATAGRGDGGGERELSDFAAGPFSLPVSGIHTIRMIVNEAGREGTRDAGVF